MSQIENLNFSPTITMLLLISILFIIGWMFALL